MLRVARDAAGIVRHDGYWRWLLLVGLAVLVGIFEIFAALAVLLVLRLVTQQDGPVSGVLPSALDRVLPTMEGDRLFVLIAAGLLAFFILRGLLYLAQTYLQHRLALNAGVRLSRRLLAAYLSMPYAVYLTKNSSELIRNASTTVMDVVGGVYIPLVRITSEAILVIAILGVLLAQAPSATLLSILVLGLLVFAVQNWNMPRVAILGMQTQALVEAGLRVLQQSLEGLRDIRILEKEKFFVDEYGGTRAALARTQYLRATHNDLPRVLLETGTVAIMLGILVLGLTGRTEGGEALTVLGLFAYAVLRMLPSVNRIVESANNISFGGPALAIVRTDLAVFEAASNARLEQSSTAGPCKFQDEIVVSGASFQYQKKPIIRDASVKIQRGSSTAIVGPTGSGKTTLLNLLLGLLEPTTGTISVDGRPLTEWGASWYRCVGLVPQNVFLIDDSFERNIALGDGDIDAEALEEAIQLAQLQETVDRLENGLRTILGERGVRVSGGQRQRIAIARALYRRPRILVMDEGTSALDQGTEKRLLEAIRSARPGMTLIVVAHRVVSIEFCDTVLYLRDGQIVDTGRFSDLFKEHSSFREFVGADIEAGQEVGEEPV